MEQHRKNINPYHYGTDDRPRVDHMTHEPWRRIERYLFSSGSRRPCRRREQLPCPQNCELLTTPQFRGGCFYVTLISFCRQLYTSRVSKSCWKRVRICSSCSVLTGLVRCRSIPAARERSRSSSRPKPVTAIRKGRRVFACSRSV